MLITSAATAAVAAERTLLQRGQCLADLKLLEAIVHIGLGQECVGALGGHINHRTFVVGGQRNVANLLSKNRE